MSHGKRNTRIQVYLSPSSVADKMVLDLYAAAGDIDKPQELFRRIVRAGIRSLYESGEIPPELVRRARLDRHFRGATIPTMQPMLYPFPYASPGGMPMPPSTGDDIEVETFARTAEARQDTPARAPAVREPERVLEAVPAIQAAPLAPEPIAEDDDGDEGDDLLGLMGRKRN